MSISKFKKAAIMATVLGGLTINSGVSAAPLSVVTTFSNNGYSDIGTINGSYVNSTIDTNIEFGLTDITNGDMKVYGFTNDGNTQIYTSAYGFQMPDYLFNVGEWDDHVASGYLDEARNVFAAAKYDKYIYTAGSDYGTIGTSIADADEKQLSMSSIDLKSDLVLAGELEEGDGWAAHTRGLMVDGDYLYASVHIDDGDENWMGFNYSDSYLMKYKIDPKTGSLTFVDASQMGIGPMYSSIAKYNNIVCTASLGSEQGMGYNGNSSLNIAEMDEFGEFSSSTSISAYDGNTPSNVEGQTFRDIKIMPDGTAYIFTYDEMDWSGSSPNRVYKTTVSNLVSGNEDWQMVFEDAGVAFSAGINVDYYTKRFWTLSGGNVRVYLDGQGQPVIFYQNDMSSDGTKMLNQGGWSVVQINPVTGNFATLRDSEEKVSNANAVWKVVTTTNKITADATINSDTVIGLGNDKVGDLSNNILATIYAKDSDVAVDATGKVLGLQVENGIGTPVGIYAGYGNSADITAGTINIITKGVTGGDSLNNAIMLDAVAEGKQSAITVNGDVNIAMTGGIGGNGIAVQKTDRWDDDNDIFDDGYAWASGREASYTAENPAIITINGDVSIKGANNQTWGIEANRDNVFSRFNNAGILTSVNKSQVNINGNVDMDVYGNGVTVNAQDSSVTIAEGGQITVPRGTNYGYYALAAYNGAINMNMGADGKTVGADDVVLNGDIFALNKGTINLALVTADSELNGIVDSAGTTSVYLQNGANWNNVQNNERYVLDYEDAGSGSFDENGNYIGVSRVTNFYGGNSLENAGIINQVKGCAKLNIDNYSGHTVVYYDHDATIPTTIYGGDVKITNAAENSAIVVSTVPTFNVTDKDTVDAVMGSLAGKLYYTDYVSNNLDATVQIAEGLVTGAVSKRVGDIEFTTLNGQGKLDTDSLKDEGSTTPPAPQPKPEGGNFESGITGDLENNPYFEDVLDDDEDGNTIINFGKVDKDENGDPITEINLTVPKVEEDEGVNVVINSDAQDKPKIIDMGGNKELTVQSEASGTEAQAYGIVADGGDVSINNATDITISASATGTGGSAVAIYASGNDVTIQNSGTVTLKANGGEGAVLQADGGSTVTITGNVNIADDNKVAVSVGDGSVVSFGGGVIGAVGNEVAIKAHKAGVIKFNTDGESKVVINGNIEFGEKVASYSNYALRRNAVMSIAEDEEGEASRNWLSTQDSSMDSLVNHSDSKVDFALGIKNAKWSGDAVGMNMDILIDEDGVWEGSYTSKNSSGEEVKYTEDEEEKSVALVLEMNNNAEWHNTAEDATLVSVLKGNGGYVYMSNAENSHITVDKYSGNKTFVYTNNYGDSQATKLINGGDVRINEAAANSSVSLKTAAAFNLENTNAVDDVLEALANKLYYTDYVDKNDNLKATVEIESLVGSVSKTVEDINFETLAGQGSLKVKPTDPEDKPTDPEDKPTDPEENGNTSTGPSLKNPKVETEVMKGAKSAMAATSMMWRAEANDLMKRMGDLRMAEGEHGIWAKYYSTKYEMDAQNAKYTNNYKAYQLGYDKKVGNWTVGAAASYGDGESTYANGRGENSVVSLGVYGAWNGKDGQYVDLIMKRSKLDNEFTINGGEAIGEMEADYNAWATSISAEYGKRFETNKGFYVEPSAEITMGRVEGSDYTTSTTKAGKMFVQQDDYDTLVGRLGLRIGQKLDKASYYAKLAVAKEFCGDYDTKYADQYGNTNSTSMNFGDTWYEMQIGGTAQLNDNSYIYASYERNFGADVEQKWRVDAGLRFSF